MTSPGFPFSVCFTFQLVGICFHRLTFLTLTSPTSCLCNSVACAGVIIDARTFSWLSGSSVGGVDGPSVCGCPSGRSRTSFCSADCSACRVSSSSDSDSAAALTTNTLATAVVLALASRCFLRSSNALMTLSPIFLGSKSWLKLHLSP